LKSLISGKTLHIKAPKVIPLLLAAGLFLCSHVAVFGQSDSLTNTSADTGKDRVQLAFDKGRWFTGLLGSINSTSFNRKSQQSGTSKTFLSEYNFTIQSGVFIKDRWLLGALLITEKDNEGILILEESEQLSLGPFSRYYITENGFGGIYFQSVLAYSRYSSQSQSTGALVILSDKYQGSGFGLSIGAGYSFTPNRFVTLDLQLSYRFTKVYGERTDLLEELVFREDLSQGEIIFSFGFNIILNEFFF